VVGRLGALVDGGGPADQRGGALPVVGVAGAHLRALRGERGPAVDKRRDEYNIWFNAGDIQPKRYSISDKIYIGSSELRTLEMTGTVYADNLPNPISTSLEIDISVDVKDVNNEQLKVLIDEHIKEENEWFEKYIDRKNKNDDEYV
jgi:hypothetical protein